MGVGRAHWPAREDAAGLRELRCWAAEREGGGGGGKDGWAAGAGLARGIGVYFLLFLYLSLFSI
jgi:hypothetical protein